MYDDRVQNDLSDLGPETTAMTTITQTGRTAIRRRRRRNGISHANLFIMSPLPSSSSSLSPRLSLMSRHRRPGAKYIKTRPARNACVYLL